MPYYLFCITAFKGLPGSALVKNLPANAGDVGSIPGLGRFPGLEILLRWQPTPAFLPQKSHGQRSLAGCSPWGHKSDTTDQLNNNSSQSRNRTQVSRIAVRQFTVWATREAQTIAIMPNNVEHLFMCLPSADLLQSDIYSGLLLILLHWAFCF